MSQYGNIGQLNIEIAADSSKATAGIQSLSRALAGLSFGNVDGLKAFSNALKKIGDIRVGAETSTGLNSLFASVSRISGINTEAFTDLSKAFKNLSNVEFNGSEIGQQLNALISGISEITFDTTPFLNLAQAIKQLGGSASEKAITNIPLLADAIKQLFDRLSETQVIRQDIIDMTRAMADLSMSGSKVGTASNKVVNGLKKIDKQAKTTKKSLLQISHYFTDLAVWASGKFFGSFIEGTRDAFNNAFKYASDLVETQNILERTFGKSIQTIEDFSRTSLKMYGMNELEAKRMTGTFQAMGTALGETKDRMSSVSTSLSALVGDYASFFNMDVSDVAERFTSVFTGMTKQLRKFGIDITNANLQEFANEQGWDVNVKSLSQYNKAIIRYNYIVSRSKDILGDFQRTQMSYANQTRIMKQQLTELFGTLGQIGTAVLTPILQVLNQIINKLRIFAEQLVDFLGIKNFVSISGGAVEGIEDITDAIDAEGKAIKKFKTYTVGIDELNILKPNEADTGDGAGVLGADWDTDWWDKLEKGEKDFYDFSEIIEHIAWVLEPLMASFRNLWTDGIKPFVDESKLALGELWEEYLEPLSHYAIREVAPIVVDITTNFVQHLTDDVAAGKQVLFGFFDMIKTSGWGEAIILTLTNVVAPAIDLIGEAITRTIQLAEPAIVFLGGLIGWIGDVLHGIVSQIDLSVITEPLKDIWSSVVGILDESGLVDKIKGVWAILQPMGFALGSVIGSALQLIFTIIGEIYKALKPIIEFLSGALFKTLGDIIVNIGYALAGLKEPLEAITNFIKGIIEAISGAGEWLGGKIAGIIDFFTGGSGKGAELEMNIDTSNAEQQIANIKEGGEVEISVVANTEEVETKLESISNDKKLELYMELAQDNIENELEKMRTRIQAENEREDSGLQIKASINTEELDTGLETITNKIATDGEMLNQKYGEMGNAAVQTLNTTFSNNNPVLYEVITDNATTIKTTFEDAKTGVGIVGNTSTVFEAYGLAVVNGFKSGVEKNKQISLNTVSVWVKDIMRTFVGNDQEGINYNVWYEYAHQVMLGFSEGITYWSYLAMDAIQRWVSEMMEEFEDDMEIESPSKVFKEYGYYTVAGFNEGLKDNIGTTDRVIDSWVSGIEDQMKAVENFNLNLNATMQGLDNLTAKVNTRVDMSGFYGELEKVQTAGMSASLNTYAESKQAIEVNIPNITLEVDSREIARANYKGQRELGYQIRK